MHRVKDNNMRMMLAGYGSSERSPLLRAASSIGLDTLPVLCFHCLLLLRKEILQERHGMQRVREHGRR
jgi:hypothetical protein